MKKIDTNSFGIKNILTKEKIENTNYYLAQINVLMYGSRFRISGVIDKNGMEIIPFGEKMDRGIRVIDENTLAIDFTSFIGEAGISPEVYGTRLYQIENNKVSLLCESNAYTMQIIDHKAIGAKYLDSNVTSDDCGVCLLEEFIYDIDLKQIIESQVIRPDESYLKRIVNRL